MNKSIENLDNGHIIGTSYLFLQIPTIVLIVSSFIKNKGKFFNMEPPYNVKCGYFSQGICFLGYGVSIILAIKVIICTMFLYLKPKNVE